MRYHTLIADFDGTLAHHGVLEPPTWEALCRLRASGRKLIMATGRILEQVLALVPEPEAFARIVAENGALVYDPATKEIKALSPVPPPALIERLRERGVPMELGHIVIGTQDTYAAIALEVIQELGLEHQLVFNKGAVMILPSGVTKGTGVACALEELGLSPHNAISIGDAENDHALLRATECGVAVANALPALKASADLVLCEPHGLGVIELCDRVLDDDLLGVPIARRAVVLGTVVGDGTTAPLVITLDPYATNALVCGTSGSGKSTITTGLLERFSDAGYQYAIVDPEGDYQDMPHAVVLGAHERAPVIGEVMDVVRDPKRNVIVNLLGISLEQRPEFAAELFAALAELRVRSGRPHWLVVDEAHHLLPAEWQQAAEVAKREHGALYITVHPGSVAQSVLDTIDTIMIVGGEPAKSLRELCEKRGLPTPGMSAVDGVEKLPPGHLLFWRVGASTAVVVQAQPTKTARVRHSRKYVHGNLGAERSFYFRGPEDKLNLRAQNLISFAQLAEGIDDETWSHHLALHHYSTWFRTEMKDPELAEAALAIEDDPLLSPVDSRAKIREQIERRYTLPADKPSGIIDKPEKAA